MKRRLQQAGLALALALATLATLTTPVAAQAPQVAGWWNSLSVGTTALPATTASGHLHVGLGPNGPTAYAALRYDHVSAGNGAVLTLTIDATSVVGTPLLVACPTLDDRWSAGGDQPWSTKPAYSCAHRAVGLVSTGGATMTFVLDPALRTAVGGYLLALVPSPDSSTPFSVDLAPPAPTSLIVNPNPVSPPVTQPTPSPVPSATAGTPTPLPAPTPPGNPGPLAVIPPATPAPSVLPAPAVFAAPVNGANLNTSTAAVSTNPQMRLIAAILLGALVVGTGYAMTRPTRAPVLLGGRGRHAGGRGPTQLTGSP